MPTLWIDGKLMPFMLYQKKVQRVKNFVHRMRVVEILTIKLGFNPHSGIQLAMHDELVKYMLVKLSRVFMRK